jgi:hypothetical protein
MRALNLISGVGIAIVATWLAVTNLAYGAHEFTCEVPWTGDAYTCFPKLEIPARGLVTISVDTIRGEDGEDLMDLAIFYIKDMENKDAVVQTLEVRAHQSVSWRYESNVKLLVAKVHVNYSKSRKATIRGSYSVK